MSFKVSAQRRMEMKSRTRGVVIYNEFAAASQSQRPAQLQLLLYFSADSSRQLPFCSVAVAVAVNIVAVVVVVVVCTSNVQFQFGLQSGMAGRGKGGCHPKWQTMQSRFLPAGSL